MNIAAALARTQTIKIPDQAAPVFRTAAGILAPNLSPTPAAALGSEAPCLALLTAEDMEGRRADPATEVPEQGAFLKLFADGTGQLLVSHPHFLYSFVCFLKEHLASRDLKWVQSGRAFPAAFSWQRSTYDLFLTQEGRSQSGLVKETYVEQLARAGFTHGEVNALAGPMGIETGPKGEAYPMFYTYCPALDQFVASDLNKELYSSEYRSANLATLVENARLLRDFGMVPGLLCFEPRSVPEEFFARYPMLRGARVDHPFRSFKPRYNMTIAHPRVRAHYAEMVRRLLEAVPELGYLSIWTNDSGAGFEYTDSLYVGRNGGPYLIREWKRAEEIASAAGENVLRFLRCLRDAAREINPRFRVMTRMESFYGEHEIVWRGLGDGLDVESASLLARGWEMPYTHPRYPDSHAINAGSVYQNRCDPEEHALQAELEGRDARAHIYFGAGPHTMFAPLLGVPYPKLTAQRFRLLHSRGLRHLAHLGGTCPPELVPYNVNHAILVALQYDPETPIEDLVTALAARWAGPDAAAALVRAWDLAEEAILAYPNITTLYATIGFTWYRLWVRPLIPNIEALARSERAYYEEFMCTTPHNPNNVDLSRDVLFQLTTPELCSRNVARMDTHLWDPLERAITALTIPGRKIPPVFADQRVRLQALRCWFLTLRHVAIWIAAVHGYMQADSAEARAAHREALRGMIAREIENTQALLELLESGVEFMATTDQGETPLMHGRNLGELLRRRIQIMSLHAGDEPFIDPQYMEREAGVAMP